MILYVLTTCRNMNSCHSYLGSGASFFFPPFIVDSTGIFSAKNLYKVRTEPALPITLTTDYGQEQDQEETGCSNRLKRC